jgi:hypothetical protein
MPGRLKAYLVTKISSIYQTTKSEIEKEQRGTKKCLGGSRPILCLKCHQSIKQRKARSKRSSGTPKKISGRLKVFLMTKMSSTYQTTKSEIERSSGRRRT